VGLVGGDGKGDGVGSGVGLAARAVPAFTTIANIKLAESTLIVCADFMGILS
jgi:hypothetical protein